MNCLECQDLLQHRLDGEPIPDPAALESHLAECPGCRYQHQGAPLLLDALRTAPCPVPSLGLTRQIVGTVLRDRRRRLFRRGLYAAVALAASILIVTFAGHFWPADPGPAPDAPPVVKGKDRDRPPEPAHGPLELEQAPRAVASLLRKAADNTSEQAKLLIKSTSTDPLSLIPDVTPMTGMEDSLEPATQSFRATTQGMGEGVQTVANRTRQALTYFTKLSLIDTGRSN